jgi:hypothetical protein
LACRNYKSAASAASPQRLAKAAACYLSRDVLERLVISREPPSMSMYELIDATYLP